jgi:hypothetical protein
MNHAAHQKNLHHSGRIMQHMRSFANLVAIAFVLNFTTYAEIPDVSTVADEAKPKSERTCRIVFPDRPHDAPKSAYLYDGKQSQPVDLPSMNFSKVLVLPKGELTLHLTSSKIATGKEPPVDGPKLIVSKEILDFYILVSPEPSNPNLPVKMEIVDISPGQLKPGETLWSNLTDHEISAKLGNIEISINPNSKKVSEPPTEKSGYYKAEFSFRPNAKDNLLPIAEQNWWHDANSRHIGFIVDSGGRLPKIYFYRDFRL